MQTSEIDIDAMEAGPAMDALIAKKAMGWDSFNVGAQRTWILPDGTWDTATPKYSTEIAVAWQLVEEIKRRSSLDEEPWVDRQRLHLYENGPFWVASYDVVLDEEHELFYSFQPPDYGDTSSPYYEKGQRWTAKALEYFKYTAYGKTAQEAICKAVLKAIFPSQDVKKDVNSAD